MAAPNPITHCDFYVYALFRDITGIPFYIGKGRGNRWHCHEREARKGACGRKYAIIRDMLTRSIRIIKVKLHEGLTHEIAHEYETALIAAIGRHPLGPLTNLTDGGDGGACGARLSPETIAKRSATQRGAKRSAEARANISAACIGRRHSPETIAKIKSLKAGTRPTPEAIAKRASLNRGSKMSPEASEKSAAKRRGQKRTPQQRQNMIAGRLAKKLARLDMLTPEPQQMTS